MFVDVEWSSKYGEQTVSNASWTGYLETRLYTNPVQIVMVKFIVRTGSKWIDPVMIQFHTKGLRCEINVDQIRIKCGQALSHSIPCAVHHANK